MDTIRVFVSSTWLDLQPYQEAVEDVLQRMRETKFIGMAYFGSRAETTRETSLAEVERSDFYIGLFGGRYGSGITEAEYRLARARGLPYLIYFLDEASIVQWETDPVQTQQLTALKEELCRHNTVPSFRNPDELAKLVATDLHNWLVDKYLVQGITALSMKYAGRIQNFLLNYLGEPEQPVPFGGREKALACLDTWLENPQQPPRLLLTAPAGRGKSALLVHWSQRLSQREGLEVIFFPISIRYETNLKSVVFAALAARLAALHGELVPGQLNTSVDAWQDLVTTYLARPLPNGRTLLVILDGLDEAADCWEAGPNLFPRLLPTTTRLVVSARYLANDVNAEAWLRRLGWETPGRAQAMTLPILDLTGVADVLIRMGVPLDRLGANVNIVNELHRLSEGDPLLVRLYVDDLWKQGEAISRLRPEDLRELQPGLKGYFDRWWDDQRRLWGSQSPLKEVAVQTVLDLLACALGPVSRDDVLDELAPPEAGLTAWTLDEALQSLARFIIGDGHDQGYTFSHSRLGIYFSERLTNKQRREKEGRFLNWGKRTLVMLEDGQLLPTQVSAYLVQYYGAHLERAGQGVEDLRRLLSDDWRRVWFHLEGTYGGFLNDVQRVWRAAKQIDTDAAHSGREMPYLSIELHCALCLASVNSLASNIFPDLLGLLVQDRLWNPAQGLMYARQVPDGEGRTQALGSVAPQLSETLLCEALAAAQAIGDDRARSRALEVVVGQLKGETVLLGKALTVAQAIGDDRARAEALAAVAKQLKGEVRQSALKQALAAAQVIGNDYDRVQVLGVVAGQLKGEVRRDVLEQALTATLAIGDDIVRALALAAVAEQLKDEPTLLEQALAAAQAIDDEWHRAKALGAVAGQLKGEVRRDMLEQALEAAQAVGNDRARALALKAVAEQLKDEPALLEQALAVAQVIYNDWFRALALAVVAGQLEGKVRRDVLEQALTVAQGIGDDWSRAEALATVVGQLKDEPTLLEQALAAAQTIGDDWHRAKALGAVAGQLGGETALLKQAIVIAQTMGDDGARARALVAVAKQLEGEARRGLLKQALTIAQTINDDEPRVKAMGKLAKKLKGEVRRGVLKQALTTTQAIGDDWPRALALKAVTEQLEGELTLLERVLGAAQTISDDGARAQVLAAVAGQLEGKVRRDMLEQALTVAQGIGDDWSRAEALATVAGQLKGEPTLLEQALAIAQTIGDDWHRARALGAMAGQLSGETVLLKQAIMIAQAMSDDGACAQALVAVAGQLEGEMRQGILEQALVAAQAISEDGARASALATVAGQLEEEVQRRDVLEQALASAQAVGEDGARALALAAVAEQLKSESALLEQALAATQAIGDDWPRALALEAVAAQLKGELALLKQAIMIAQAIGDDKARAQALMAVAGQLEGEVRQGLLQQGLVAAQAIGDDWHRAKALASVLSQMEPNYRLWLNVVGTLGGFKRASLLHIIGAMLPLLEQLGGKSAIEETAQAIQAVSRWWP